MSLVLATLTNSGMVRLPVVSAYARGWVLRAREYPQLVSLAAAGSNLSKEKMKPQRGCGFGWYPWLGLLFRVDPLCHESRDQGVGIGKGHRVFGHGDFLGTVAGIVADCSCTVRSLSEAVDLGPRGPTSFRNLATGIGLNDFKNVIEVMPVVLAGAENAESFCDFRIAHRDFHGRFSADVGRRRRGAGHDDGRRSDMPS